MVKKMVGLMKELGVTKESVVAAYAANSVEVIAYSLAAASIGAIFTSISADFGVEAVIERIKQTNPVLLLVSQVVYYNGKLHSQKDKNELIVKECDSIKACIQISNSDRDGISSKYLDFDDVMARDFGDNFEYSRLPFNHPLYILYSSGTTGNPKCIVHSAGGTLIQHLKEHLLHGDVQPNDIFFQFTSIGWMMWHWSLSVLGTGATLVLFDGSPLRPNATCLWKRISGLKVTHFGTSARYLISLQEANYKIPDDISIEPLRVILSTGSPLPKSTFEYVYRNLKSNVILASITGGTDIISLFCGGNPVLPVHAGEIQCVCLGMDVRAHSEQSDQYSTTGEGDLVCAKPFPAMPIFFWNDPQGEIYRRAYFEKYPGFWYHGDYIKINAKTGGIVMLGRSDGTLNPKGIRFGSADLYNILAHKDLFPMVEDCLAVSVLQRETLDEDVYLFVKLKELGKWTEELEKLIRTEIRKRLSPRHVPYKIMPVPDIPYTINGKKIEVSVKKILNGETDLIVPGVANPSSLDFYRHLFSPKVNY